MENDMELHQAVYLFLLTQIQFGFYRYAESLPAMEETGRMYHVSVDTVRPAYHRLRQEGYISLSKKAGAKVLVQYGREEIREHIQSYFSQRKTELVDLCQSMRPLFGWAQWLALKHAPEKTADCMEQMGRGDIHAACAVWKHLQYMCTSLGNEVLLRLVRYIYFFFQGPLFCAVKDNCYLAASLKQVQDIAALCRQRDWDALPEALLAVQDGLQNALCPFCGEAGGTPPEKEIFFRWDAYKKSSQRRYSLAMELIVAISRGIYPAGSYLPAAAQLSAEKGVSVSTVRRTIDLLNRIGAVKSARPLGALVLPPAKSTENCDFTQPDIQRRLLDLAASLQIFALSGRAVSRITLASLDSAAFQQWKLRLLAIQNMGRYGLVTYASLELISNHAPYRAIRTIYSELLRLFFWGNPLRGMRGDSQSTNAFFAPYFERMLGSLEGPDIDCFAATLENLLLYELRTTVQQLRLLGIQEAEKLLVPGENECWS